jgi:hypothetical protein
MWRAAIARLWMSAPLTAPLPIFELTTAFGLSCAVPTLLGGNTASRAASPTGVQPSTATTSAVTDKTVCDRAATFSSS